MPVARAYGTLILKRCCNFILCKPACAHYFCKMKCFCFILAIYMLLLGCLPCGDANDCTLDTSVAATASHNGPNHDDDKEHCSPFCVCTCCAVPIVQLQTSSFAAAVFADTTFKCIACNEDFSSQHLHNIWQPPRV